VTTSQRVHCQAQNQTPGGHDNDRRRLRRRNRRQCRRQGQERNQGRVTSLSGETESIIRGIAGAVAPMKLAWRFREQPPPRSAQRRIPSPFNRAGRTRRRAANGQPNAPGTSVCARAGSMASSIRPAKIAECRGRSNFSQWPNSG
jgi:hypothetical protein